jgi:hypothetical protein
VLHRTPRQFNKLRPLPLIFTQHLLHKSSNVKALLFSASMLHNLPRSFALSQTHRSLVAVNEDGNVATKIVESSPDKSQFDNQDPEAEALGVCSPYDQSAEDQLARRARFRPGRQQIKSGCRDSFSWR